MPKDYYRVEVHFSSETNDQLMRLGIEVKEKTGKKLSRGKLVKNIVEEFFTKTELANRDSRSK